MHWGVPDEENGARELIRNVLVLLSHCLNCTALSGCYFVVDNKVEMIVEKPKYAIEGVHKGMTGCVMSSYAIKNEWLIVFSEEGTGKDIAELCVSREDFKVIK